MVEQVKNRNFLSPLKFDFSIDRLKNVNFFAQSANIPSVSAPETTNAQGTPFSRIPWQGDHMNFSDLVVDFKVDEDLSNYFDIFIWMVGESFPQNFKQYADLKKGVDKNLDGQTKKILPPTAKNRGHIYGQGFLFVRNSQNNVIATVKYQDVYPTSLSEIKFDSRDENVVEVTCTATFKYDFFTIERP